jgi:hypothetical protein
MLVAREPAHHQQAGDQFQLGIVLAILAGARIRCDRFAPRIAQRTVDAQDKAQRRGEALFVFPPRNVRGVRLTIDNEAEDPVLATEALERQDLLVYPFRLRGRRRAQHDLAGGALERRIDQRPEIGGARERESRWL